MKVRLAIPRVMALQTAASPSTSTGALSTNQPLGDRHSASHQYLLSTLTSSSFDFLQPTQTLQDAALIVAKQYLDPLAVSVSAAQQQRLQDARRKRKRRYGDEECTVPLLRLKEVHLEGFEIEQVWMQAQRVMDASRQEIERRLEEALKPTHGNRIRATPDEGKHDKSVRFEIASIDPGSDASDVENIGLENLPGTERNVLINTTVKGTFTEGGNSVNESDDLVGDDEYIERDDMVLDDNGPDVAEETSTFTADKHGLNDGFFSIDNFNRSTEFAEQFNVMGGDNDSSDDGIYWDTDLKIPSSKDTGRDKQFDSSENDGPTFGNANLNAHDTDSDNMSNEKVLTEAAAIGDTNDISYADFFVPPPQPTTKSMQRRPLPKTQPPPPVQSSDADLQQTISTVRRDLFEDETLQPGSASYPDADDPRQQSNGTLSTHERRQAALAAQIRTLEAESIAKRKWTLSGEASAAVRPLNSLLEEDLDFERAGKPVPVITTETSEDIEALIKRRILTREFDEVTRRQPDTLAALAPGAANAQLPKRGRFDLPTDKDERSLAEIYEQEHLKTVDPDGFVDKRTAELKKQHAEIERLWASVSAKLDALSSWNYRPNPPQINISVVTDVPTVQMEDARPGGGGAIGISGEGSRLAPQEVFKINGDKIALTDGVVLGGQAGVVARDEMTRDQKLRRRRREKERIKKAGGIVAVKTSGAKGNGDKTAAVANAKTKGGKRAAEEKELLLGLKKGGVKVIGKGGEIRDIEGGKVSDGTGRKGAGGFKL